MTPGLTPGPVGAPGYGEVPAARGGFFGFPFGGAPSRRAEVEGEYSIDGGLAGEILATDNIFPGRAGRRADVVGSLRPDIRVGLDTIRLQGFALYAPTLRGYASEAGESRLDHRGSVSLLGTIVPDSVFLDFRGSAGVQRITGGSATEDEASLPRRDRAQTASLSATPYVVRRFGGLATALAGYTLQYGLQDGTLRSLTPGGAPFFAPQEFTSHTAFAAVRTGEDFGRLAVEVRASGTVYTGDGVLDGAHRASAEVEARYAFIRGIAGLVEVGYEWQEYEGSPPIRISEPTYGIGVRLDPAPDTLIILRYRHRDGFDAPSLVARVGIGPRTALFASYADELTTTVRRGADLLTTTAFDALDNPVDPNTGAPSPSTGGSLLALQNALIRNKRAAIGVSQTWDRERASLTLSREERIPVSTARGTIAFRQESGAVTLSYARDLTPDTTFVGTAQYGRFESSTLRTSGDSYSARATLVHRLSPDLTGSLQYQVSNRFTDLAQRDEGAFGRGNRLQNAVILTLRRRF